MTFLSESHGESAIRVVSEQTGPDPSSADRYHHAAQREAPRRRHTGPAPSSQKSLHVRVYGGSHCQRGVLESSVVLLETPFPQEMLLRKVRSVLDGAHRADPAAAGRLRYIRCFNALFIVVLERDPSPLSRLASAAQSLLNRYSAFQIDAEDTGRKGLTGRLPHR